MLVRTSKPLVTDRYFGVPRYMLRKLMISLWHWNSTYEVKRRFYHKLRIAKTARLNQMKGDLVSFPDLSFPDP